ncbi:MAG: family 16 glycosylhydrolase, partial [Verrucomicrobia bacterium]|nr:family 16 glycosylhydrolase [Verrucomicrobiota bacterium]
MNNYRTRPFFTSEDCRRVLLAVPLLVSCTCLKAQLSGPVSVPPGGRNLTRLYSDANCGDEKGQVLQYSSVTAADTTVVYWGVEPNMVKMSLDGDSYTGGEIMAYNADLSNPSNGVLVWAGQTSVFGDEPVVTYTRCRVSLTDHSTGQPLSLTGAIQLGLPSNMGALSRVASASSAFDVIVTYTAALDASGPFEDVHTLYHDRLSARSRNDSYWNYAFKSFSCGFYLGDCSFVIRVRDQTGAQPGMPPGARVVRYPNGSGAPVDTLTTDTVGDVAYLEPTAGTAFDFEVYYEGSNPFDGGTVGELWATATATFGVTQSPLVMQRDWPYVETLRVFRIADGWEVPADAMLAPGHRLRLEALVSNQTESVKDVTVNLAMDRNRDTSWDHTASSYGEIGGESTRVLEAAFTVSEAGSYHRTVKTSVNPGGKTDAWDWTRAFNVLDLSQYVNGTLVFSSMDWNKIDFAWKFGLFHENVLRSGEELVLRVTEGTGVGAQIESQLAEYHYGTYRAEIAAPPPTTVPGEGTCCGFFFLWREIDDNGDVTGLNEIDVEILTAAEHPINFVIHHHDREGSVRHFQCDPPDGKSITDKIAYEFRWYPDRVEFWLDGAQAMEAETGDPAVYYSSSGYFPDHAGQLMLNHWTGDDWAQYPPKGSGDQDMHVYSVSYSELPVEGRDGSIAAIGAGLAGRAPAAGRLLAGLSPYNHVVVPGSFTDLLAEDSGDGAPAKTYFPSTSNEDGSWAKWYVNVKVKNTGTVTTDYRVELVEQTVGDVSFGSGTMSRDVPELSSGQSAVVMFSLDYYPHENAVSTFKFWLFETNGFNHNEVSKRYDYVVCIDAGAPSASVSTNRDTYAVPTDLPVEVIWTAYNGDMSGDTEAWAPVVVDLFRGTDTEAIDTGSPLVSGSSEATGSYPDNSVSPGHSYRYHVLATDKVGHVSEKIYLRGGQTLSISDPLSSTNVTVADATPSVSEFAVSASTEGGTSTLTCTLADLDDAVLDVHVDWGDGNSDTYTDVPAGAFSQTHSYGDDDTDDRYTVSITVADDDGLTVTDTTATTVTNVNPAQLALTPLVGTEDTLYSGSLTATDVAADPLTWTKEGGAEWLSVMPDGSVNGMPDDADTGEQLLEVSVVDGDGGDATATFRVVISEANDPPRITPISPPAATEEVQWSYQVLIDDPDDPNNGEDLTFELIDAPDGMTVSTIGLITWTPTEGVTTSGQVALIVSDGGEDDAPPATEEFAIDVTAVNDPPVINSITGTSATEDIQYAYEIEVTDPDDPNNGEDLTFELIDA